MLRISVEGKRTAYSSSLDTWKSISITRLRLCNACAVQHLLRKPAHVSRTRGGVPRAGFLDYSQDAQKRKSGSADDDCGVRGGPTACRVRECAMVWRCLVLAAALVGGVTQRAQAAD